MGETEQQHKGAATIANTLGATCTQEETSGARRSPLRGHSAKRSYEAPSHPITARALLCMENSLFQSGRCIEIPENPLSIISAFHFSTSAKLEHATRFCLKELFSHLSGMTEIRARRRSKNWLQVHRGWKPWPRLLGTELEKLTFRHVIDSSDPRCEVFKEELHLSPRQKQKVERSSLTAACPCTR